MRNAAFKSFRRFVLRGGLTLRDDAILLDVAGSLVKKRERGDETKRKFLKEIRNFARKKIEAFYSIRFFLLIELLLFIISLRLTKKFFDRE